MAASATFALKAGEWFRRGRLFMVSPVHGDYRRCQAEIPLIVLSRFPGPALLTWGALRAAIKSPDLAPQPDDGIRYSSAIGPSMSDISRKASRNLLHSVFASSPVLPARCAAINCKSLLLR